jgi:protoporphyrinogen IX oxidase
MNYLWFKAFHIVGVVAWFAGLFYIGRLFVYHTEANEQPEPARTILQQQYQLMEKRLYKIIMTPGMVFTVIIMPNWAWWHFWLAIITTAVA